jgi:hypothetical protein
MLVAMWKRHISHNIQFRKKTHICKAYVKNVMGEGYEIFVVMAWASFVKYRMGENVKSERPSGRMDTAGLKDAGIKQGTSRVPVAHAYNPCYSGGRDQEDHSSKPARANSS